ncbi:MAG: HupE/UreJ family protein, partial [Candidatus Binatia bacterium]
MTTKHLAAIVWLALLATPAAAHDRSVSYSDWQIAEGDARIRLRVSALDASFLANEARPGESPADYFARRLTLASDAAECPPITAPLALAAPAGTLVFEWTVRCPASGALAITSRILAETVPGHLHFAHVRRDDRAPADRLLGRDEPTWHLATETAAEAAAPVSFAASIALGIFHVATGIDHVAFLAALLLGAAGFGEVLAIVTAFTIAHSLTLALAALGSLVPEASAIEALIGLSIALVAAENLATGDVRGAARLVGGALVALAAAAMLGIGRVPAITLLGL